MSRGGDSGGAVDVDSDVPLLGHERLAGVDAHANADRAAGQRVPSRRGGGERVRGFVEGDEERVALCVHLDAVIRSESPPQLVAMLGQSRRVAVAELVQQPGRSLDVREEEGDGAARKLGHRVDDAVPRRDSAFLESAAAVKLSL